MKNKYNILLFVFILILVGCFAVMASGVKITYIENYGTNFRRNVKGISDSLGLNLPQPVNEFLSKTPEPLTTEERLALIEQMESEQTASPSPEIEQQDNGEISAESKIIAVKDAYAAAYASYKSGLLYALDTLLICYNKDGSEAWTQDIQVSDPILKTAGNYILIAEKGASKIYLFSGQKKLWEGSSENPIVSCDVSSNGDIVVVSDKPLFRGAVTVFNRRGNTIFSWNSGSYEILDADISPASRHLAVSLLNTDNGADTKILFFNLKETESFNAVDLADSIVFDIEFCKETLTAVADNKILGINANGKVIWTNNFDNKVLHRYYIEDSGYKMCVFDNNNAFEINILNNRGGERANFESKLFPNHVHISNGYILYDNDRTLIISTLSGKAIGQYNCTRDIYKLYMLEAGSLAVVYNSSIEFVNY